MHVLRSPMECKAIYLMPEMGTHERVAISEVCGISGVKRNLRCLVRIPRMHTHSIPIYVGMYTTV